MKKYTSSNRGLRGQVAFFLDLILMREMPVGDVSFILNGKSGRLIIIIAIILWNSPGFNQKKTLNVDQSSNWQRLQIPSESWFSWFWTRRRSLPSWKTPPQLLSLIFFSEFYGIVPRYTHKILLRNIKSRNNRKRVAEQLILMQVLQVWSQLHTPLRVLRNKFTGHLV